MKSQTFLAKSHSFRIQFWILIENELDYIRVNVIQMLFLFRFSILK